MRYAASARSSAVVGGMSLAAVLMVSVPTLAETSFHARVGAKFWSTRHGQVACVTVNDQPLATLRIASGGMTPAQRALTIKGRLSGLVSAGLTPSQVGLVSLGKAGWELQGQGARIILISPGDGATQGQSAKHLAHSWASTLKMRLSEPPLSLARREILVPFGTTRTVSVGGAARAEDISLAAGDGKVSQASYDPRRRLITLRGTGSGQVQVQVQTTGAALPLTVSVRKYAAFVLPHVTVRVSGRPFAPASLVQTAVYLGLKHALSAADGAQMRLLRVPSAVGSLRPGASVTRRMALRVAGPDLLPVEAAPLVTVVNQPLAPARAGTMFYSNNPEQVKQTQTLFTGPLSLFQPARLDYHHQNETGLPLIFHADLVNASDQTASVHVMAGIATPEVDTIQIGRRAGAAFLQALDSGTGLVMDVPPHARVPLLVQRFAPLLTVSGIVQVQQISGRDRALSLSVVADQDQQALVSSPGHLAMAVGEREGADARLVASPAAPLATGSVRETSPYVFGAPRVQLTGSYAVGGKWAYLRLGHSESLKNAAQTQTLWGNYGVSYFVTVHLTNPTGQPRTVGMFFAPEAGLAAGVFQVSGEPLLQFDPMPPPEEKELTRVRLNPGETRMVRVRTILLNGSAYPASLVVHAL